jgi:hypothetical protein
MLDWVVYRLGIAVLSGAARLLFSGASVTPDPLPGRFLRAGPHLALTTRDDA